MSFRKDTYTGGEHYWIQYENGTHNVKMEAPDYCDENEIEFTGSYDECVAWLDNLLTENVDYDLNL